MIKRVTVEVQLADGPLLEICYEYMVLSDGGELQLVAWEPWQGPQTDEGYVPDLILNKSVYSVREAEQIVRYEARNAMGLLVQANMTTRCTNCD